uniref:non-specific serine/threonine protein kinase n=1 Tax=Labrus bergylta TaxID=56723 RepID=A0A3Q3EXT5_9LABR
MLFSKANITGQKCVCLDVPFVHKRTLTKPESTEDLSALFQTKYKQGEKLGAGGCGSVFAGFRKADNVPVAIKHIPKDNVVCKHTVSEFFLRSLILITELILVLERPVPSKDLLNYTRDKGGALQEEEAKVSLKILVVEQMFLFHCGNSTCSGTNSKPALTSVATLQIAKVLLLFGCLNIRTHLLLHVSCIYA